MAYTDLATIQTIATGQPFAAATLQAARDSLEFLIDPPSCSVYNSAAQTVTNNTATDLTADSETYDNDSMHSTSSNTARITIQTPGRYLLIATVRFAADVDGYRTVFFRDSGATDLVGQLVFGNSASGVTALTAVRSQVFSAADYVTARVQHTAGADLDCTLIEFVSLFMTR